MNEVVIRDGNGNGDGDGALSYTCSGYEYEYEYLHANYIAPGGLMCLKKKYAYEYHQSLNGKPAGELLIIMLVFHLLLQK